MRAFNLYDKVPTYIGLPSYYVLRADMLDYFITEIEERLPQTHNGWQVSGIFLNPTVIHYPSYRKWKHPYTV